MDVIVYAALGPDVTEHDLAYRLLAAALERELGLRELPEIARKTGGKPYFPSRPDICFSLSHSHGAAVCALHDNPVGIDVEQLRPAPQRLAAGLEDEAFFRLWTAREASIKRRGLGIAALLRPTEPDKLCRCLEGLLDGYIVTVCPSDEGTVIQTKVILLE